MTDPMTTTQAEERERCTQFGGSPKTATLIASTSTNGTTALTAMPINESGNCSLALETNSSCTQRTRAPSSCGGGSPMTASTSAPANSRRESTARSSETKASTYRHRSFDKRMQSLMQSGLIAGITPTSIAKRWPQRTLDFASSQLVGVGAAGPRADCSCLSAHSAASSIGGKKEGEK